MKLITSFLAVTTLMTAPLFAQTRWDDSHSVFDNMGIRTAHQIRVVNNQPSAELAVQAMHNFAACVVTRSGPGAVKLLAMDERAPDYHQAVERLAKGNNYCAPGSKIKFNSLLFVGGLAERLFERETGPKGAAAAVAYDAAKPMVTAHSEAEMIGMCVVRKAPTETSAIFETEPATKDEDQAIRAIGQALVACVPTGQKMAMNRPGLRAMLALSAYRLAEHNQGNGPAVEG